jgi:hypothetical protein
VGVVDAAVIGEGPDGTLRIDRAIEFREKSDHRLGQIFTPEILSHPSLGRDDVAVAEHFSSLGFRVNLLREIAENIPHDGAALVVLLREEWFQELRALMSDEIDVERWTPAMEFPMRVEAPLPSKPRRDRS